MVKHFKALNSQTVRASKKPRRATVSPMRGSRGRDRRPGPPPPLKTHKNKWFLSNSGTDPLSNHKATKPDSMLGYHQHANETQFKWRFAGGLILDPPSPNQLKQKRTKNVIKVGLSLTKFSGSAHEPRRRQTSDTTNP